MANVVGDIDAEHAESPRMAETPHPGGHMKAVGIPGTRRWLPLPAAVLILAGLAAGCSSSKPAYCTDAANLKTSVQNLGNADVAKNGLSSLQTALSSVKTNAASFATDAKSAYPSQTAALNSSLSALQTAITSAKGQPPVTAAAAVASAVTQVKNSASALQDAAAGKC